MNFKPTILITIPSYKRPNVLARGLVSLNQRLIIPLKNEMNFLVHVYLQDTTCHDNDILEKMQLPEEIFKIHLVTPHDNPVIGDIVRSSVFIAQPDFESADILILSDDDFMITENNPNFLNNFKRMVNHFILSDYVIASAKMQRNVHNFKIREWPKSNGFKVSFVPFKERFILINLKQKDIIKILFSSDISEISMGEDVYLFLKALIAGFKICLYIGLTDFRHLQHEDDCEENITGGYSDLVSEKSGKVLSPRNYLRKYQVMAGISDKTVQHVLSDFFHWEAARKMGRRIRGDIYQYISDNIKIDPDSGNIVRINGKMDHVKLEGEKSMTDLRFGR